MSVLGSVGLEERQDLEKQPISTLIQHIMFEHHLFLRTELPLLSECIQRSMLEHGSHHKELIELHYLFQEMKSDLEQHLFEEEDEVFPWVVEYTKTHSFDCLDQAKRLLGNLELAHSRVSQSLLAMRLATRNYLISDEHSATIKWMYLTLVKLETKLLEHIRVENDILYPLVRKLQ